MDREALVLRNRLMTEAFHRTSLKHHVRRAVLEVIARLPLPAGKKPARERILLIRPDHLGDVLLTTPAIHALRATRPHAEIHMLVGPWSADIVASYPEIDAVLTLAFPAFSRTPKVNWRSPYQLALSSARHLREIGYSSAVILRPDHWWGAMMVKLAGIPQRIGYDLPQVKPFLTDAIPHQHQHAVLQNLCLIENWTKKIKREEIVYHFPTDPFDRGYVDSYLETWGIGREQAIICIHAGTGTRVKHWQEGKWASVADTLAEQLEAQIVLTGGVHELPLARAIAGQMKNRVCIMAGDTRVRQLGALFERAKVVLGPDSGPLHLAAAVGTPTVALYGPADPLEFGPWGTLDKHIALTSEIGCRPCRVLDWGNENLNLHPCVQEITVGRVLEAARRVANSP